MRKIGLPLFLGAMLVASSVWAQTVSQPETITVVVTPIAQSIGLSSSTVTTAGPNNAGSVIGTISLVTNPPGGPTSGIKLSLSGGNAGNFALTNSILPSNLLIGTANLPAGTYGIMINATP